MLTCKDASQLISEREDRPLTRRERWGLRLHLWICANCRRFEQQLVLIREALRQLGRRMESEANNARLSEAAKGRIRQTMAERDKRER